jgi:hypothetical protein
VEIKDAEQLDSKGVDEVAFLAARCAQSRDTTIGSKNLGSFRDSPLWGSNGLVCLSRREKYCHNGGMALAHHHGGTRREGVPARGVRDRHRGPSSWLPGNGPFAGEKVWGSAIRSRWGQQWARLPFPPDTHEKYCQNGGMAFAQFTDLGVHER